MGRASLAGGPLELRTRQYKDLLEQFSTALARAKGETLVAQSQEEARRMFSDLLHELGVKQVAAERDLALDALGIPEEFPTVKWAFAGATPDFRQACLKAELGVTSATFVLAETGSLVVASGPHSARMTSLIPPVHLAIVPRSRLLPSIFEWQRLRPDPMPSNVVLISGPSKTADIEQTLIVGVHGPKRLIILFYPD